MDAKEKLEKIFYENFISSDGEKFVVEDNQEFEVRIKIQKDVSRCRIKSAEISAGNQILTIDGSEKFLNNIFNCYASWESHRFHSNHGREKTS